MICLIKIKTDHCSSRFSVVFSGELSAVCLDGRSLNIFFFFNSKTEITAVISSVFFKASLYGVRYKHPRIPTSDSLINGTWHR